MEDFPAAGANVDNNSAAGLSKSFNIYQLRDAKQDMDQVRRKRVKTVMAEREKNSILAAHMDVTSTTPTQKSNRKSVEDKDLKKLEARDRIHRAKEYALSKHQHNWGMFHGYKDGAQMEKISREEWDTEVFSETLEEPRCSRIYRGISIFSHLAMFGFCLYFTLTIFDNTIENGGQSETESDFNFEVCPELCRPDSTSMFDFKQTATCQKKFATEFDRIVWRQSTHLDKTCADTCTRHSMKCKAYYPKSSSELHSAAERAGFFCNVTHTRGRLNDSAWSRYVVFEDVKNWTDEATLEYPNGPVYVQQYIAKKDRNPVPRYITDWGETDEFSLQDRVSNFVVNLPTDFGRRWLPWSSVLYMDMDPNLEYKSKHMCEGPDCSPFTCDLVAALNPECKDMFSPDVVKQQKAAEHKCHLKCRDFINPDDSTRIFPFEHNELPLPSGPCMQHSPGYISPRPEGHLFSTPPESLFYGDVPPEDAVCTAKFPDVGVFNSHKKFSIRFHDVVVRPLSKGGPKARAQLLRQAQQLQLDEGLKPVLGDETMQRLLFGGGGFVANYAGNAYPNQILVAHKREPEDKDRHECEPHELEQIHLDSKSKDYVCINWHLDLVHSRLPRPIARQLCPCEIGGALDPCQHTVYHEEEGFKRSQNATDISDNEIRYQKGVPAYSVYWREPVDGQSCTMDSTAHYYRFNGRYSHMLEKIFILLMNLSMVYTLTLALYNIYVASRRYKPTREHNWYITAVQFFSLVIVFTINMYLAWCLFITVRTSTSGTPRAMRYVDTASEWQAFGKELQQLLQADHSQSFTEKVMTGGKISDLGARIWERYLVRDCEQQPSSLYSDLVGDITVHNGCVQHGKVHRLGVRTTCKHNRGCSDIKDRATCANVPACVSQTFRNVDFAVESPNLKLPDSLDKQRESLPKGCLYVRQSTNAVNNRRDDIAKLRCNNDVNCKDWQTERLRAEADATYPFSSYCYWNEEGTGDVMVETEDESARAICSCENTCESTNSGTAASLYCRWAADADGVSTDPQQCLGQCEKGSEPFDTPHMCGLQLQLEWMPMQKYVVIYSFMVMLLTGLLLRSLLFQILVVWWFKSKQCDNCKAVYTAGSRRPSLCNQCGHVYCPKCLVHERTILGKIHGEKASLVVDAVLQLIINPVGFFQKVGDLCERFRKNQKAVCSTCFATTTTTAMHRLQLHTPSPGQGLQIEIVKTYQKLLDTHYKATKAVIYNLDGEFNDPDGAVERHVDDNDMLNRKMCSCLDSGDHVAGQSKISMRLMQMKFERDLRRTIGVFWWMSTTTVDPKTKEQTTVIMGDLVKESFVFLFDALNKKDLLRTWVGQLFKWIDMNDDYNKHVLTDDDDEMSDVDVSELLRHFKSRNDKMKIRAVRKLTKSKVFRPDFVELVDRIIAQVDNSATRSEADNAPPFLSERDNNSSTNGSKASIRSLDTTTDSALSDDEELRDIIPVHLENFLCAEAPAGVENTMEPSPGEKLATYFWSGMDMEQRGQFRKALAWYSPLALSRPLAVGPPPTLDDNGHPVVANEGGGHADSPCAVSCDVVVKLVKSNIFGDEKMRECRVAIFTDFIAFLKPEVEVIAGPPEPEPEAVGAAMQIQDMHSLNSEHFAKEASKAASKEHGPDGGPAIVSARLVFDLDEHLCGVLTRAEVLRASVISTDPCSVQLFVREGEPAADTVKKGDESNAKLVRFVAASGENNDTPAQSAQSFAAAIQEWRARGMDPDVEAFPFESCFPVRKDINTRLLFGGKEYFDVLCDTIMAAEHSIMISSCDFMPELYLKRDKRFGPVQEFRLDLLLQNKARQGVLVYILLSPQCQSLRSPQKHHPKSIMSVLNPVYAHNNIIVHRCKDPPMRSQKLRHSPDTSPDRMPYQQHDISVVVDNSLAFVGGIDLSLGSYEEWGFPLADPDGKLYPGRCYKNILESHLHLNKDKALEYRKIYNGGEAPFTDKAPREWAAPYDSDASVNDRLVDPRMPRSQVQVMVDGKAALDVAASFLQRWNNASTKCILKREYLKREAIWLQPVTPKWKFPKSTQGMHVQVLRSLSNWSGGSRLEVSIYRAYLNLIESAKTSIYIESEVFVSSMQGQSFVHNRITKALYARLAQAILQDEDFRVVIVIPIMPLPLDPAVDEKFTSRLYQGKGVLFPYSYFNIRTLCQDGGKSFLERLYAEFGPRVDKYISVLSMQVWAKGNTANPLDPDSAALHEDVFSDGTSTQVYAGKMLIVDDMHAVFGSANINDRSMLGHRNSELALYLRDTETHELPEGDDGEAFRTRGKERPRVGTHLHRFRMQMFNKLLGLPQHDYTSTADFVHSYDRLVSTAVNNTELLHKAFPLIPHSEYRTFKSFTSILGVESHPDKQFLKRKAEHMAALDSVQGTVIKFPMQFLDREQHHFVHSDSMSYGVTSDKSIANRYT